MLIESSIRPLQTSDIRARRASGRNQILSGGVRLVDGIPFGRPYRGQNQRPPIPEIPPRKRRRLLFDAEEEESLETQQEVSDDRQIVIREDFDDVDADEEYLNNHRKRLLEQPFDGFEDEDDESEDDEYAVDASSEDSEVLDEEDADEELALLLQDQKHPPESDERKVERSIRPPSADILHKEQSEDASLGRRVSPRSKGAKNKATVNKESDVNVEYQESASFIGPGLGSTKKMAEPGVSEHSDADMIAAEMRAPYDRGIQNQVSRH